MINVKPPNEILRLRRVEETKPCLRANGMTIWKWSIQRGFSPNLVYSIVQGRRKCIRGKSLQIAVALRIKAAVTPPAPARNGQTWRS